MAKLSNINGRFAVEDDGAIQFNGQAGTDGYVLESRGDSSPPVWTDRDTGGVIGTGTENKVVRWNAAPATGDSQTIGNGPITFSSAGAAADSTFGGGGTFAGDVTINKANPYITLNDSSAVNQQLAITQAGSTANFQTRGGASSQGQFIFKQTNGTTSSNTLVLNQAFDAIFAGNVTTGASLISTNAIVDNVVAKTSNGNITFKNNGGSTISTFNNDLSATFAGKVSGIAPTSDLNFATKKYVDDNSGGAVTKIIGGTNVTVSPSSGLGDVTVNADLAGTVTGSGTANVMPFWTSATALGDSIISTGSPAGQATVGGVLNVSGNANFLGSVDVLGVDDIRVRFLKTTTFKAGLQVPTTAGDMITNSAVDDFCIRSQTNILFATGGATERMRINSAGNATFVGNITAPTLNLTGLTNNGSSTSVLVLNQILGSELITNGDFDTSLDWTVTNAWSIANGKATYGGSGTSVVYQAVTLANATQYRILFTVSGSSGNGARIWIGNSAGNTNYENGSYVYYANGTHERVFTMPSAQTTLGIYSTTGGSGYDLDLVSLKQVLGTGTDVEKREFSSNAFAEPLWEQNENGINNIGGVKVGIGTDSPNDILHVSETGTATRLRVGNNGAYDASVYFNTSTDWTIGTDTSNSNAFTIGNGSTVGANPKITITTGGNVGIGTTGPNKTLELGYSNTEQNVLSNGLPGGAAGTGILVFNTDTTTNKPFANIDFRAGNADARIALQRDASNSASFHFITDDANTFSTKMFIKHSGEVGIGTTLPSKKLHIVGDQLIFGNLFLQSNANGFRTIAMNTADAADNQELYLCGGATASSTRGAQVGVYGNEVSSTGGSVVIVAGNVSTGDIDFLTANEQRMIINNAGNVGIGVTGPLAKLHIEGPNNGDGNDYAQLYIKGTGTYPADITGIVLDSVGSNQSHIRFHNNGTPKVQIRYNEGNNAVDKLGVYSFTLNTNIAEFNNATGAFVVKNDVVAYGSPSDKRLKENIKPIESALYKVSKLQGVTFDWKEKGITNLKEDIGFIAQDVKKVVPELVRENEDGMLSMRHQGIAPILLEAIKELKAEIEELKSNKCNCNK